MAQIAPTPSFVIVQDVGLVIQSVDQAALDLARLNRVEGGLQVSHPGSPSSVFGDWTAE